MTSHIWRNIALSEVLLPAERRRQRQAIVRDFAATFQAMQRVTLLHRAM